MQERNASGIASNRSPAYLCCRKKMGQEEDHIPVARRVPGTGDQAMVLSFLQEGMQEQVKVG